MLSDAFYGFGVGILKGVTPLETQGINPSPEDMWAPNALQTE